MDKRFFSNLGNAVRKTATSKDLTDLSHNIDDVLSEVRDTVRTVVEQQPFDPLRHDSGKTGDVPPAQQPPPKTSWQYTAPPKKTPPPNRAYTPPPVAKKLTVRKPARGNALGVVFTTLGSVFIPLSALALVIGVSVGLANGAYQALLLLLAIAVPILVTSIIFAVSGKQLRARYRRCKGYLKLAGNAQFLPLKQLAADVGKTTEFVAADIKRMLRKQMLPNAYLDEQATCLMLDTETYEQYLAAEKALKARQAEEEELRRSREADPKTAELYRTIEEGNAYIRQIKEANDAIPAEDISEQLFRLEQVTTRIFAHVEKHPEKLPEISKFMRYYLPTTLKLVNAYRDFEQQTMQGDNIRTAKSEIHTALSTINKAFENLLDSLFEDDALDISTDISVLQSMLAQEGLTDSDFKKK